MRKDKFTWNEEDIVIEEPKKKTLKELFDKIKSYLIGKSLVKDEIEKDNLTTDQIEDELS